MDLQSLKRLGFTDKEISGLKERGTKLPEDKKLEADESLSLKTDKEIEEEVAWKEFEKFRANKEAHEEAAERIRKGEETIEDIALFPPIKPFMFTQKNIDGTMVPVQVKNSEVLLTKAMAERKDVNGNIKYPKFYIFAHITFMYPYFT